MGWLDPQPSAGKNFEAAFSRSDLERAPASAMEQECETTDPAHILFTSGSTGMPKGVVITHSNVIAFVTWALEHFGIDHTDRFSGHTPFHFDLSTFDIFGTFAAGAELHLVPPAVALLPPKLVEFIRNSQLTQWFSVPSVLNYIAKFNALRQNDFPSLRRVLWCGEVLPTPALVYWMKHLPHVRFTNLYGPTEATIASSYYDVPACPQDPRESIPIGRACGGEELLVLDEDLDPVLPGHMGNLYIGGAGLSPGYWRDPEKTASVFLPDPRNPARTGISNQNPRLYRTGDLAWEDEAGCVYFVGRTDTQIKSRGYRIELGEIETALNSFDALQECAIVAIQAESFGGWMICCAYVPRGRDDDHAGFPAQASGEACARVYVAGPMDAMCGATQECQWKSRPAAAQGMFLRSGTRARKPRRQRFKFRTGCKVQRAGGTKQRIGLASMRRLNSFDRNRYPFLFGEVSRQGNRERDSL